MTRLARAVGWAALHTVFAVIRAYLAVLLVVALVVLVAIYVAWDLAIGEPRWWRACARRVLSPLDRQIAKAKP